MHIIFWPTSFPCMELTSLNSRSLRFLYFLGTLPLSCSLLKSQLLKRGLKCRVIHIRIHGDATYLL